MKLTMLFSVMKKKNCYTVWKIAPSLSIKDEEMRKLLIKYEAGWETQPDSNRTLDHGGLSVYVINLARAHFPANKNTTYIQEKQKSALIIFMKRQWGKTPPLQHHSLFNWILSALLYTRIRLSECVCALWRAN